MAKGKQRVKVSELKGIRLYNYLLKRLAEENQKLTKKQQMGIETRRRIVSKQLYPKFKQQPTLKIGEVTTDLKKIVRALPPKEICNPLYLSEAYLAFVEYYEIDNHIRTVLPDCLDVKVNAGYLGKTKIFNTRNYSYNGDGVRKIIENIRVELEENKSGMAYFSGVVKLKPKKKNDGTPENYYVEYVLYINDNPEADDTPIIYDLPNKEVKKVERVRDYLAIQLKDLQKEKRKRKRQAKKARPKTEKELKEISAKEIRNAINSLKRLLQAKIITKEQFEEQKASILKLKK
jgi:hypothetical protein